MVAIVSVAEWKDCAKSILEWVEYIWIPIIHAFAPIKVAFHPILHLILTFSLPIKAFHAHQAQGVSNQVALDREVQGALHRQGRGQVDLHQPRLQVAVDQDVVPKQLEAVRPVDASFLYRSVNEVLPT